MSEFFDPTGQAWMPKGPHTSRLPTSPNTIPTRCLPCHAIQTHSGSNTLQGWFPEWGVRYRRDRRFHHNWRGCQSVIAEGTAMAAPGVMVARQSASGCFLPLCLRGKTEAIRPPVNECIPDVKLPDPVHSHSDVRRIIDGSQTFPLRPGITPLHRIIPANGINGMGSVS